jgi:NADPH:quinone reductase-like Zn-dependent oxidoreductase
MSTSSGKHLAAIVPQKGGPLTIVERTTPTCGPKQLLIEVHAIAFNPADCYQRDMGIFIVEYPAVIGSDVAGIIVETGSDLSPSTPTTGTRVTAFASSFYHKGSPDHGALQKYVLVSEDTIAVLPDSFSFVEGCVFPMAALTSWNGWLWAGISREPISPSEKKGVLVWGASSSMGALAVQGAKRMGYNVYATASPQHHEYLKTLGAARVFDYKAEGVSSKILDAANEDGIAIRVAYHATGAQQVSADTISKLAAGDQGKLAIAPIVDTSLNVPENVESAFVKAPDDPKGRVERFHWIFGTWLQDSLAAKRIVASPKIKIIEGGLESANKALDELMGGVSCTKLVIEI